MNAHVECDVVKLLWPGGNKNETKKEVYYTHRSQRGVTNATQCQRKSIRVWTGGRRQEWEEGLGQSVFEVPKGKAGQGRVNSLGLASCIIKA